MNIKKIIRKVEQYAQEKYEDGFDNGFIAGDNYEEAFDDGALAERERIQSVIDLHIQWALESGKGSEVVMLNRIKEVIVPITILPDEDAF
jgi:hypothetical protein